MTPKAAYNQYFLQQSPLSTIILQKAKTLVFTASPKSFFDQILVENFLFFD